MRYLKRTEADCGLGLGDDQRYIAEGDIVAFDEDDPIARRELDTLTSWTHGWEQVTATGEPVADADRWVPPADLFTEERQPTEPGSFIGEGEPLPDEGAAVDSPPTTL
jgi:hypothetical protein